MAKIEKLKQVQLDKILNTMINKSTLEFLTKLKENNDRDWFAANKKAFETEQKLAKTFFTSVGEQSMSLS